MNNQVITISITEAKARFYEIFEKVIQGETFLITRYGKPAAYLKPFRPNMAKLTESNDKKATSQTGAEL